MDVLDQQTNIFGNDTLLALSERDLEKFAGDDLSSLLDMDGNLATSDIISDLPDDLDMPLFEPSFEPMDSDGGLGASLGGDMGLEASLLGDDPWKDFSDGSDSGIDCLSVKQEPMSPTSSQCSELSNDAQNILLDAASIAQQSESDLLAQLNFDTTLGATNPSLFDSDLIKLETPDTPPLTPITPHGIQVVSQSILKPLNSSIITSAGNSNSGTARAITFATNAGSKTPTGGTINNIKVVLPMPGSQNGGTTTLAGNKIKIQPKPLNSATNTTNSVATKLTKQAGKPLVLTPEEFAKLTAQGVLKLQSPSSNKSTNLTTKLTTSPTVTKTLTNSLNTTQGSTITRPVRHTTLTTPITMTTHHNSAPGSLSPQPPPGIDVDVKAWKRQQRMIKNRESACLSRKRKKEYLSKVEQQMHDFMAQNEKLHHENNLLRKKVDHLTKENDILRRALPSMSTVKKVTSLLAIFLIFSFNFSSLSIFSSQFDSSTNQLPALSSDVMGAHHQGRHLLSFTDSDLDIPKNFELNAAQQYNIADIQHTMNLLRKSMADSGNNLNNNDKKSAGALMTQTDLDKLYSLQLSAMCPMYYNSTESQRLMNELTGWVLGQKAEFQRKEEATKQNDRTKSQRKRRGKKFANDVSLDLDSLDMTGADIYEEPRYAVPGRGSADNFEVQVFNQAEQRYGHFMDAVNRRNDTFYVVSFRNDHLLLPATATNKTMGRPRMSLVMPAMGLNETMRSPDDSIAMMQIDCEVTATRLIHIHKNSVPANMREDNATFFVPSPSAATEDGSYTRAAAGNKPPSTTREHANSRTSSGKNSRTKSSSKHLPREPVANIVP